jgi:hypothetical protein
MVTRKKESAVQSEIIRYCKARRLRAIKMTMTNYRGVPDLVIPLPGGMTIWVEVKRPGSSYRQTPVQEEWLDYLRKMGHQSYIVRSLDEFRLALESTIPSAGGSQNQETGDTAPN